MLCVLAPGISFAFSDRSRAAPCLTDETNVLGIVHVHELGETSASHTHKASPVHENSAAHAHVGQLDHKDMTYVADETPAPGNGPHKTPGAHCCGMVCLSALPAALTDIVKPAAPMSLCTSENYQDVVDNAPPRLYRPPIS
jgi:hypothetical protein